MCTVDTRGAVTNFAAFSGANDQTNIVTFSNSLYYLYPESLNSYSYFLNTEVPRKVIYPLNWKFAVRYRM